MSALTITEFLKARIAEDEAVARGAIANGEGALDWADDGDQTDIHIARHDPARVLAECAAKRAIIELHDYEWMGPDDAAGKGCAHDYEDWPCPTIRALAAVHAEHPDYQQEWAL